MCCCYLLCMCVWTIFGDVVGAMFPPFSSMCRTSEIDGRCVHLRGSDRCEISYVATLTRSMCRSTFEDPIDVNFIIMLLYSCTQITPGVCTLVLFIIIRYELQRFEYYRYCGCPACVCVCLFVVFCDHVHRSRPRNIGT